MDWFERITGFREQGYTQTQAQLQVKDGRLVSPHSDRRPQVGLLQTPSLGELRAQVAAIAGPVQAGRMPLEHVRGDVRRLHADAGNALALFQVASQFNLLEMVGPDVTPEAGVTRYQGDHTQGPACAQAAGAATIYRNYLLPMAGGIGQTARQQIDCLADHGRALGNEAAHLWTMRNGYPLFAPDALHKIEARLAGCNSQQREMLKEKLRIGLHWHVEVTDLVPRGHLVSQAFCSALPKAYQTHLVGQPWQGFARLVLEAAYEATLLAGVLNLARSGCPRVYLTRLGGGAFGNDAQWITTSIDHALAQVGQRGLQVVMVSLG